MAINEKSTPIGGSQDKAIEDSIRGAISAMLGPKIADFKAEVSNGVVTLSGKSVENALAEHVVSMVKAIPGVKNVISKIVSGTESKPADTVPPHKAASPDKKAV